MGFHAYKSLTVVIVLPTRFKRAKEKALLFKPFEHYQLNIIRILKFNLLFFFFLRNMFSDDEIIMASGRTVSENNSNTICNCNISFQKFFKSFFIYCVLIKTH